MRNNLTFCEPMKCSRTLLASFEWAVSFVPIWYSTILVHCSTKSTSRIRPLCAHTMTLKAAAVTEATRAHWPTCSLHLNFTQYFGAMMNKSNNYKTKTDTFERIIEKCKYGILRGTTSTISVKQVVAALPYCTGNSGHQLRLLTFLWKIFFSGFFFSSGNVISRNFRGEKFLKGIFVSLFSPHNQHAKAILMTV